MIGNRIKAAEERLVYDYEEHKVSIIGEGHLRYKEKVYKRESVPEYLNRSKSSVIKENLLYWWQLPEKGYKDKGYKIALLYHNSVFRDRILVCDKYDVVNTYFRDPLKE